eukprot:2108-Eustigmatos_ZCMA.PRE.1
MHRTEKVSGMTSVQMQCCIPIQTRTQHVPRQIGDGVSATPLPSEMLDDSIFSFRSNGELEVEDQTQDTHTS